MFPAGVPGVHVRRVAVQGGLQLRVAEAGPSGGTPTLLLHGWGASLYMWRGWFGPLAAAGRRAIAVDLPGHGLSDKPDRDDAYRLEALAATISSLMDAEGIVAADVVAQSMAGTIAIELALATQTCVRRLALVNPACFGRIRLQALGRAVSPPMVDHVLPRLVTRGIVSRAHRLVYGDPSLITDRDEDEYWAPSQFPGYARAMRRLLHVFSWARPPAGEMAARLRLLREPALVVLGTRDRLVRDARSYAATLRELGAPLVVREVNGGGHAVNEERPKEVVALAMTHLTAGEASGQHRAT
jgi:pimeloyl-ACP methyl ester carboxylesterase